MSFFYRIKGNYTDVEKKIMRGRSLEEESETLVSDQFIFLRLLRTQSGIVAVVTEDNRSD